MKKLRWQRPLLAGLSTIALNACSAAGEVPAHRSSGCITDQQVREAGPALVYVWSPRMVLSALEAHQAKAAATTKGLRFVPVVDGRLATAEWEAAQERLEMLAPLSARALETTRPLCASQLLAQLAYRHFPTAFVVVAARVHPAPIVGAMPEEFWSEGLRLRTSDFIQRTQVGQNTDHDESHPTVVSP